MKKKPTKIKESEYDPYCPHCGGCGFVGCCGIKEFLKKHVRGKTNCSAEELFIRDIESICEYSENEWNQWIEKLIVEEILIAHSENQPTSRLTSLMMKIKKHG